MLQITYHGLKNLKKISPLRYINADILFPLANIFGAFITSNPSAITIVFVNMVIACALMARKIGVLEFGFAKTLHPLRVTAICTTIVAGVFLLGSGGNSLSIIQGISFLTFSVGNFIQSSPSLQKPKPTLGFLKAFLHPALWYGMGYTFTGLTIAGGASIFENAVAALFTIAGIVEIIAALVMSTGKIVNRAGPFIGVAIGTLFLFFAGVATGNIAGALCALCAGLGELSLAIATLQEHNREASRTGTPPALGILTRKLQGIMDLVGIAKT